MTEPASPNPPRGRFVSAARVFTALTLVSRIFGVVRDKVCAAQFGNGAVWSAWSLAFSVPNLFRRLFGEGALTATLVPVLTDYEAGDDPEKRRLGQQLVHAVVTLLVMLLASVTIAVEIGLAVAWGVGDWSADTVLTLGLTAVLMPYVILVCLTAILSAILNVRGRFAEGAGAPIVLNVCIILGAGVAAPLLTGSPRGQIFTVAVAVLIGGVLQVALIWRALHVRGVTLRPRVDWKHPGVRRIIRLMGPMVAGLAVIQFNTLMDKVIAWALTARNGHVAYELFGQTIARFLDEGAVATLDRATRLYELPLGLFSVAIATAIFPALSRHASEDDPKGLADTLRRGLEIAMLIAIPATVGLLMIRVELVQLIFQGRAFGAADTDRVAWVMSFYVIGLAAFSAQGLLIRAFYAMKQTRFPIKVGAWMVGLNLPLNLALLWWFNRRDWGPDATAGLALSTSICAVIQAGVLAAKLRAQLGRLGARRILISAGRTCVATGVMAVAVWVTRWAAVNYWGYDLAGWVGRFGKAVAPVLVGGAVFFLVARLLRIEAMRELVSREH